MVAEEPGTRAARALFINEPFLIAPDLALLEVFMPFGARCARGNTIAIK